MGNTNIISKNNIKIRSITNLLGCILLFVAGLAFVLFIDLKAKTVTNSFDENKNTIIVPLSIWLFFAILFALGGGIFYFFGDSQKHKKVLTLVLKGVGIVLSIGYVVFLFVFKNWVNVKKLIQNECVPTVHTIANVSLVFAFIGIAFIIINYIMSIIYIEEDY